MQGGSFKPLMHGGVVRLQRPMSNQRRTILLGRVAALLLLLAALAPSVSRAVQFVTATPAYLAEICTTAGLHQGNASEGSEAAGPMLDCPLCLLQLRTALLPPPAPLAAALLLRADLRHAPPQVAPPVPRLALLRVHAQPRAPPVRA